MDDYLYSVYFFQYYSAEYKYTIRPTIRPKQNVNKIFGKGLITTTQVNSALHASKVTKSDTTFSWGKGGKVIAAMWQVTLCDAT